jgi:hypothetical protein
VRQGFGHQVQLFPSPPSCGLVVLNMFVSFVREVYPAPLAVVILVLGRLASRLWFFLPTHPQNSALSFVFVLSVRMKNSILILYILPLFVS